MCVYIYVKYMYVYICPCLGKYINIYFHKSYLDFVYMCHFPCKLNVPSLPHSVLLLSSPREPGFYLPWVHSFFTKKACLEGKKDVDNPAE